MCGNPTGGPASSPWANGNPSPAPAPPPPSPCLSADLFSECFGACSGVITPGSPGPVCGYTYTSQATPVGQITFTPGLLTMSAPPSMVPIIFKTVPKTIPSLFGVTAQWIFQEVAAGAADYIFLFTNHDNSQQLYVQLGTAGDITVEVGPTNNQAFYSGTWTPNGGLRKLSIVVSASGVPTAFMDGVSLPLTLFSSAGGRQGFENNAAFVELENADIVDMSFSVQKIFLASGNQPNVSFCCP
jgi:hypothetical protein